MVSGKIFWKEMLGLYVLFSLVIGFAATFSVAIDMFHAQDNPDKSLEGHTIHFNKYGEYRVEFTLMLIAIPGIIIGCIQKVNELNAMRDEYGTSKEQQEDLPVWPY